MGQVGSRVRRPTAQVVQSTERTSAQGYGKHIKSHHACCNFVDDSPPFSEEPSDHVIRQQLRLTFSSCKPWRKKEGGLALALKQVAESKEPEAEARVVIELCPKCF